MDDAMFRIKDVEAFVRRVSIGTGCKVVMQLYQFILQMPFKRPYISPVSFSTTKLSPSKQEILH